MHTPSKRDTWSDFARFADEHRVNFEDIKIQREDESNLII